MAEPSHDTQPLPRIESSIEAAFEEKKQKSTADEVPLRPFDRIMGWVVPMGIAIVLALFVRLFIGGTTTVRGESMYPTLSDGDLLVVSKLATYRQEYHRADIVILDAPHLPDKSYIKRIVGLPGERVRILDGNIYINDQLLKEKYIPPIQTTTYKEKEWQLGEGEYFVLGDNRIHGKSNDGRLFGPIRAEHIHGVAVFRLLPLNHVGPLF